MAIQGPLGEPSPVPGAVPSWQSVSRSQVKGEQLKSPLKNASSLASYRKRAEADSAETMQNAVENRSPKQERQASGEKLRSRSASPPRPSLQFIRRLVRSTTDRQDYAEEEGLGQIRAVQEKRTLSLFKTEKFDLPGGPGEKLKEVNRQIKEGTVNQEELRDALVSMDRYIAEKEGRASEKVPILQKMRTELLQHWTNESLIATANDPTHPLLKTAKQVLMARAEQMGNEELLKVLESVKDGNLLDSLIKEFASRLQKGTLPIEEGVDFAARLIEENAVVEAESTGDPSGTFMRGNSATTKVATAVQSHLFSEAMKDPSGAFRKSCENAMREDSIDLTKEEGQKWLTNTASSLIESSNEMIRSLPPEQRLLVSQLSQAYYNAALAVKDDDFAKMQLNANYMLRAINPAIIVPEKIGIENPSKIGKNNLLLAGKLVQNVANHTNPNDQKLQFAAGDNFVTNARNQQAMAEMTKLLRGTPSDGG